MAPGAIPIFALDCHIGMTQLISYASASALLLVDVQYDFLPAAGPAEPAGSLAVPDGDQILPVVQDLLHGTWNYVVASQVWSRQLRSICEKGDRHVRTRISIPKDMSPLLPAIPMQRYSQRFA
jgi:nicotinamidase-related amidase